MKVRSRAIVPVLTAAALLVFAAPAFADTGAWEAVAAWPIARVFLGVASIVFTAALSREATR
jgi:hypothetical protein